MKKIMHGFSLIEAMISALVVSVGLLGLARLQGQLWASMGQVHTSTAAYRVGRDTVERLHSSIDDGEPLRAKRSFQSASAGAPLRTRVEMIQHAQWMEAKLHTRWEDAKGQQSVDLTFLRDVPAPAADTRWLLPGK